MSAIVQEVTGPVSFLVKLKDGHLIRRHQDHLRCRIPDGETEKPKSDDIPEILIDSVPVASNPTDSNSTPRNSEGSSAAADPTEILIVNPTPEITAEIAKPP